MNLAPYDCALAGAVTRVDLAAGGLHPTQLAVATRGRRAVVLVALAGAPPPRNGRDGLRFPESRWVTLSDEGPPTVRRAPGFEPDAAVALGDDGGALVVSYARRDVRAEGDAPAPVVQATPLTPDGRAAGPTVALEGSAGLVLDAPLVAFRDGFAAVLGRDGADASGARLPVREALYVLDAHGRAIHAPWGITDAQGDDSLGRYRVGAGVVAGGDELALAWTVADGSDAGVWSRRFDGGALGAPTRVASRTAWGAEIARDGSGVLYRTGGETGAPVRLLYAPWRGGQALSLGAGWDPSTAFVRGRLLVAGVALSGAGGEEVPALVAVAAPGQPLRAVVADAADAQVLASAVDLDLAATDDGALLAWIEPVDGRDDDAPRRLGLARVRCR